MLNARMIAKSLCAATALVACATPAAAQRVDRIVAFGDSYADDGNLFALIGQPFPSVYPTGRFSGGTNYIDTLGQILNVPIDNFAIGGAFTTNDNTVAGPGVLGFPTEYLSFLGGGGPAAFPRVSGTFDQSDLLAISIGGNDARFYQQNFGTLAGAPAAAATAVASASAGLNALVGAGAPTISFLAGNTANLPEIASDPAGRAVRNAFATAFNAGIQTTLAGYAANGVIVNYTDLYLIGDRIVANPAAFGLTSAGACNLGAGCITNPAAANQFLFYVDQIHLTSAGFAIVARYVATQLQAPLTLQATSDLALDTARQFGRTLTTRMDLGAPRDGDMSEGMKVYLVGDMLQHKVGSDARSDAFDVSSVGATAGLEYGFGNGVFGLAANYARGRAKFGNDAADTRANSYQIGAYAGFGIAGGFAQGYFGYGKDDHKIRRAGVIDAMRADPNGNHTIAGAKAGYLMPMGIVRVGPVVALDYAKAKVDGYTESGDAALTLNVDSLHYRALTGSAGLELRGDFAGSGIQLRPFIAATIDKDFTGDGRTIFYAQTSAPIIVNHYAYEDRSKKAYARLAGGASAAILSGVSLDAAASSTFGKKQGEEVSAHIGVKIGF